MRTLIVSRDSWFIQVFLWVWETEPEKVDICRLFWGTVFFPLAFVRLTGVWRFVPRIAFFYAFVGVVLIAIGKWPSSLAWFAWILIWVVVGYVMMLRKKRNQTNAERKAEKMEALSRVASFGLMSTELVVNGNSQSWRRLKITQISFYILRSLGNFLAWILIHTVGLVVGLVLALIFMIGDSRPSRSIGSFFGLLVEYIRSFKERTCWQVRIEK